MIMAIDPGVNGAIACWHDGRVVAHKMPDTIGDLWDFFSGFNEALIGYPIVAYMENVGKYVTGNSGPSSTTFSNHVGHLEMALVAAGIPLKRKVSPATWMRAIGCPTFLGPKEKGEKRTKQELAKAKAERKRWIKDAMQRQHPQIKVTLVNADALGILTWALNK